MLLLKGEDVMENKKFVVKTIFNLDTPPSVIDETVFDTKEKAEGLKVLLERGYGNKFGKGQKVVTVIIE
jgi:hypothetical protein